MDSLNDHPNCQLARRLWTAVADADAETMAELLDENVVWRSTGHNSIAGEYRGVEGTIDFLSLVGESAETLSTELKSIFVNDDGIVVTYHVSARRRGRRLEMDYLLVAQIRRDRVTSLVSVPLDQRDHDAFWGSVEPISA